MKHFVSKLDMFEIEAASWYRTDGICELTKEECDYVEYRLLRSHYL